MIEGPNNTQMYTFVVSSVSYVQLNEGKERILQT